MEPPELELDEDEELDEEDDEDDEVEYFVDVLDVDSVRTSVPKPLQFSQSSSSAPSTFVVVSDPFSAPHISHWGIPSGNGPRGIKYTTCVVGAGRRTPRSYGWQVGETAGDGPPAVVALSHPHPRVSASRTDETVRSRCAQSSSNRHRVASVG